MDDGRIELSHVPHNAETRLEEQTGALTPTPRHYVRSHFPTPAPPARLTIDGAVRTELSLSVDDVRELPSRSLVITLECAGNGRRFLDPPAPGEQWGLGAVSTAEWTGAPLREILERAGLEPPAVEVLFRGADEGEVREAAGRIAFERSLTVADALDNDVLVAYAMNGEPLPPDHGAPLRLVVPGLYGMASVKWLTRITAIAEPFRGFYQADRYVIDGRPLGPILPRAVIAEPADGARLARARQVVRGYAWSGGSPVARVEISVDGGSTWREARLLAAVSPHAWREWRLNWDPTAAGTATLVARAITADGMRQGSADVRNALGYANNAARPVWVEVL